MRALRKLLGMGYVEGDFWIAPTTEERVPLFPMLKMEEKAHAFELAQARRSFEASEYLMQKTQCTFEQAKMWILYRDDIRKFWK